MNNLWEANLQCAREEILITNTSSPINTSTFWLDALVTGKYIHKLPNIPNKDPLGSITLGIRSEIK